jgi:GNAT superfamily N-acetyltransferase
MSQKINIAQSSEDILRCFPALFELRPHLVEANFVERVRRQQAQGYCLAFIESEGAVRCVAGYRLLENLYSGRFLYLDDLVTPARDRSKGFGDAMMDWLEAQARAAGCAELHLDSGVQRFAAHRFYLRKRMDITCHHFALKLPSLGNAPK